MKSPKSKNLMELSQLGIPVPYFQVIQYGEQCPNIYGNFNYAVRSAPFVSMAGIMDSVLDVKPHNVPAVVEKVFASWYSPLAQSYRNLKKIPDDIQMEIIVQAIVYPNNGFAGIIHTSNPVTGKLGFSGSYVANKFADNLCKGVETGKDISTLPNEYLYLINRYAKTIEKHYSFPQDIEFVIDSEGKFWVVQVRPAQMTNYGFFNWCSEVDGGKEIAQKYADRFDIEKCIELENNETPIAKCEGVSGDVLDGEIGKDVVVLDVSDISQFPQIYNFNNIILLNGNIHNHFAVEARKAKKNCVIWNKPPQSGKIWIHVQSGQVFAAQPKANFVNKLKEKLCL